MFQDQLIRSMGGIRLNLQQQTKLAWLAETRQVPQEQVLYEIVDEYLGGAVPQFSTADRERQEQGIKTIATKFGKQPSVVKENILANKGYRYHLKDAEAKSYRDYLILTGWLRRP
jgi:hypothetical protein